MIAALLPTWLTAWHIYIAVSLLGLAATSLCLAFGGEDVGPDPYDGCCIGPDPAVASSAAVATRAFLARTITAPRHHHPAEASHEGCPDRSRHAAL